MAEQRFRVRQPGVVVDRGVDVPIANLGAAAIGEEISVRELAELIAEVVEWKGKLAFNTDMSDGTPRKLVDVTT